MQYFVTITRKPDHRTTVTREADNAMELLTNLEAEFGEQANFEWTDPHPVRRLPVTEADFEAEGRRMALESMDLPDGAYCAMAEELGLDPY